MQTDRLFRTHVFVPHTGQFVINELPILDGPEYPQA